MTGSGVVAVPASFATLSLLRAVDDRGRLAGNVGGVVHVQALRDLPLASLAAKLPHALDLMRPALHVGLRQVPATGVGRQLARRPDAGLAKEFPRVPARAI